MVAAEGTSGSFAPDCWVSVTGNSRYPWAGQYRPLPSAFSPASTAIEGSALHRPIQDLPKRSELTLIYTPRVQYYGARKTPVGVPATSRGHAWVGSGLIAGGMGMSRWGKFFPRLLTAVLSACLQPQAQSAYLRISVDPSTVTILVGETKTLTATVLTLEGHPLSVPTSWWSSDSEVATVGASGLLRGLGAGSTTIHARAEGLEAVATIQVSLMQLRPERPRVLLRDTLRLTLFIADSSATIVQRPADVWISSEPTIASIDSNGVVTGRAPASSERAIWLPSTSSPSGAPPC